MDKKHLIVKWLAIGIILLFIGVAVAPSINQSIVTASTDDDLLEVTTQACGINGYGNTTVKLTREQYQNLESYLVEFRTRLNQTTTREEAVPIFKAAVVELSKYGLLPKGMNVERAQRLVIRGHQNQRIIKLLDRTLNKNQLSTNSNFLCLTTGQGNPVIFFRPIFGTIAFFYETFQNAPLWYLYDILSLSFYIIDILYTENFPLKFLSYIGFGEDDSTAGHHYDHPFSGTIFTIGLSGVKKWSGSLNGGITKFDFSVVYEYTGYYIGAVGFSGINIRFNENMFFLGTSSYVNITYIN
jgi:hypothetical protein